MKIDLWHPDCEGYVNGIRRKKVLEELAENYSKFETPIIKAIKKIRDIGLIIILILIAVLSTRVITDIVSSEREHEETKRWFFQQYYGDKEKVKALKANKTEIAEASDEGIRKER